MKIRLILPVLLTLASMAQGRVVINEIFYHAPDDLEELEYVELHNTSQEPVDLSGWMLRKGLQFTFPANTRIEAKGYLVLCRNLDRFREFYDVPVTGTFTSQLSRSGERIELADGRGKKVDSVRYFSQAPWPVGAAGYSGSLERISPDGPGDDPYNWASSPLSKDRLRPAGTPGKVNSSYSAQLPPAVLEVTFAPEFPKAGEPVQVQARVRDSGDVSEAKLLFRLAGPGFERPETELTMRKLADNRYQVEIPGQPAEQLIRFRVQAVGTSGAIRTFPAETEPRPALSCYVAGAIEPARIPFGWIINTTQAEFEAARQRASFAGFGRFGPRMFGRGFGGPRGGGPEANTGGMVGPRGFGGPPGPGGPGPAVEDEANRRQAQTLLESGADLPALWFALTVQGDMDFATQRKLRGIFAAKLSERDKVIDDLVDSPQLAEKLKSLPELTRKLQADVADSLKGHLTPAQEQTVSEWMQKPALGSGPGATLARMVNGRVNLEAIWDVVSVKAELGEGQWETLRQAFREVRRERQVLTETPASPQEEDTAFRDRRERADDLQDKLFARITPLLSPAQQQQLASWREAPPRLPGSRRRGGPEAMFFPGRGGPRGFGRGNFPFRTATPGSSSSQSAFVYFDPETKKLELFDFVQVAPRASGLKIHFYRDQPLRQMTTVNLIFENERSALAEPLAYEVYRRAGIPAPQSYHVRLWINGQALGYQLLIEQPNRAFLRRNKIHEGGNLYKILWYESGVVGQHEKKTHIHGGHEDIVALVEALEKNRGDDLWQVIEREFDLDEVADYFAVNMVISNWDGFFNNYFTYHDLKGTSRWTMFPWDEDQTWGIAGPMGGDFYNMPLTFGMEGDVPPGQNAGATRRQGFGFGFGMGGPGAPWWRPGGYFSKPLLANSQFRKLFLARTRQVIETVYTEPIFGPIIDSLGERLRDEVRVRAEIFKLDATEAEQELQQNLTALHTHLVKRREYLLAQDEMKAVAKSSANGDLKR